jgi:hypothetical protein
VLGDGEGTKRHGEANSSTRRLGYAIDAIAI